MAMIQRIPSGHEKVRCSTSSEKTRRYIHNLVSPIVQRWIENAREDPEAFWGKAAEQLPWLRKWDQVFEWTPPTFRWFVGGQTNRFSCKKCAQ